MTTRKGEGMGNPERVTRAIVAKRFGRSTKTIKRWIDEGKRIVRDGKEYFPEQNPGGRWEFIVKISRTN